MRTSVNIFSALPADILQYMFSWLNLHGPKVKLIEGDPTEEERRTVIATAVAQNDQSKPDLSKPDLSTYHLIRDYSDEGELVYKIGFCKGRVSDDAEAEATADDSLSYDVVTLDPKSPLLRYVTEDFQDPKYSKLFPYDSENECNAPSSQDRLLLKYLELKIKAAGGLTSHPLRNRTRLATICQDANAWMNGYTTQTQVRLFEHSIKEALLDDLLHHIAYDERDEARAILELDPSLILSPFVASVTDCSPERMFHKTTAFQFAVWNGNWHMWEMMLDVVNTPSKLSDEDRAAYMIDLRVQFLIVEDGLESTIDNLLNKGVQILDADTLEQNDDEKQRYQKDVVARNAYHLIIRKDDDGVLISCVLGYRDPTTGEYTQHHLPQEHPLFSIAGELHQSLQEANDGYDNSLSHFITRANRNLKLVRTVLDGLGVKTKITQRSALLELTTLEHALENRIQNISNWTYARRAEDWYVTISALLRLFPARVWTLWTSNKFPWAQDENTMRKYVLSDIRSLGTNYYGESIFPISSFLGDKFAGHDDADGGSGVTWPGHGGAAATFIKIYLESSASKAQQLKRHLKGQPDTQPCCLM